MNEKLVGHLECNGPRILAEWRSRFAENTSRAGLETSVDLSEMIGEFYSELVALLRGENVDEIISPPCEKLPHHAANGFHIKLSCVLELFLSGEEVIRDDLFLKGVENHNFSLAEATADFGSVNRALHALMRHYIPAFCEGCFKPISEAAQHVITTRETLQKNGGKVYVAK